MWTRRDFVTLATAAVATFGLTVTTLYPRLADAVDQTPVTGDVKVPTLDLGTAQVSAALDPSDPQTIIFTVKNASDDPATVEFIAQLQDMSSMFSVGRSAPPPLPSSSDLELSINLQPGETQTIRRTVSSFPPPKPVTLTRAEVQVPQTLTLQIDVSQPSQNPNLNGGAIVLGGLNLNGGAIVLGGRFLTLASKDTPTRKISALKLTIPPAPKTAS